MADHDPRVYFAAERTLLAWIRTGLATVGLGFVVARFGLFLQMLEGGKPAEARLGSTLIGVGLVALGAAAIAVAAQQHAAFCQGLPASDRPTHASTRWPIAFAALAALASLGLAGYLLFQSTGG